jgi:hypothetical protein
MTERDTNLTQVQGPRGEVKPLHPAFLYCTAIPPEVYKVLITKLKLDEGRRTYSPGQNFRLVEDPFYGEATPPFIVPRSSFP